MSTPSDQEAAGTRPARGAATAPTATASVGGSADVFNPATDPEWAVWDAASQAYTPDKALERIDSKANFVFSSATLAATVATGFGLLGGATGHLRDHRSLTIALVVALLVALVLAGAAVFPSFRAKATPQDLGWVRSYYTGAIRWRGWFVRLSMTALATALLLALVLVLTTLGRGPRASLTLQWVGSAKPQLVVGVTVSGLPLNDRVTSQVVAVDETKRETVLLRTLAAPDSSGTATTTATVSEVPKAASYRLTVVVRHGDRQVLTDSALLPPQALP